MKVLRLSAAAMDDKFANEDVAIEILSRLPVESVQELSCVSKRWYGIFSSAYFANAHFQRSPRTNPGLLVQRVNYCFCCQMRKVVDYEDIDYVSSSSSAGEKGKHGTNSSKRIFEFLPEKTTRVVASSNGVVLCCNLLPVGSHHKDLSKKVVLYVCNPLTKEVTSLSPKGRYKSGCSFGFAYDPSGSFSTSSSTGGSFQVVMIIPPGKLGQDPYCFNIYSSKTGQWRKSKQVCMLPDILYQHQSCYASGVFYWMTTDDSHIILGFDTRRERCEVMKLPGHKMQKNGKCMGVSEGKLQYVSLNMFELVIWELDNSGGTPNWIVRHKKLMIDMNHPRLRNVQMLEDPLENDPLGYYEETNVDARPYALQDDMLYMLLGHCLGSYDVKTGKIEEFCYSIGWEHLAGAITVIPYCKTLLQVQNCSAIVGRTKRRPGRILKKTQLNATM